MKASTFSYFARLTYPYSANHQWVVKTAGMICMMRLLWWFYGAWQNCNLWMNYPIIAVW